MNNPSLNELIEIIQAYSPNGLNQVKKAYEIAEYYHNGQYRASGEAYIIHPLNVAYTLADMHADVDTICAALLHDTLEDTDITADILLAEFNEDVVTLVEGVTKLSNIDFYSKEELSYANTRKILTGLGKDVRIILIKLADRLHNMQTLNYKNAAKQQEKAHETLEIFVPLAYNLGLYKIKNELEDLCLQYIDPKAFEVIKNEKEKIEIDKQYVLDKMADRLQEKFVLANLNCSMWIRSKNVYGIYKKIREGSKIDDVHDLLTLKIVVEKPLDCYLVLGIVHQLFHPINPEFRDYISNPRTNMYQSLHTTVFAYDNTTVQVRIRSQEMDLIARNGIAIYWDLYKDKAKIAMQENIHKNYQFFNTLAVINEAFSNDSEFIEHAKTEILTDKVYVYDGDGNIIELPKGATIIDYIYRVLPNEANKIAYVSINDQTVAFDYVLSDKDRVKVYVNELCDRPDTAWEDVAITTCAKKLILEQKKILD